MKGEAGGIRQIFERSSASLLVACNDDYLARIDEAIQLLTRTFRNGGKLLVFGNGGSAADAQHICAELAGRFNMDRPGLPAIALAGNPPWLQRGATIMTSRRFSRGRFRVWESRVIRHGQSSPAGNSKNVLLGCQRA